MLRGGCLCGGVRYEIDGGLGPAVHCHCTQCRKASGASFATNASLDAKDFRFVSGEELMGEFESSPGQFRRFCTRCGSQVVKRFADKPEILRVRMGTLDDDPEVEVVAHVFLRSKTPWLEIADEIPQHE